MSGRTIAAPVYYGVFAALIGLTFLTVGVSFLHLGAWHAPVALAIATTKAALVALFFMHLIHESGMIRVAAAAGLFWLAILMGLTLTDFMTRHWLAY
jgi:cytochrome c oxidase subunit 4